MTPTKEETKLVLDILKDSSLKKALEDEDSRKGIGGREKRSKVVATYCPDKRTKQEKEKDEKLKKIEIDILIEGNPSPIDAKISNQIKDLKFYRVILIVGKNVDLTKSVAICISRIYTDIYAHPLYTFSLTDDSYTVRRPGFKCQSYIGWNEVDIKDHLFSLQKPNPLIDYFKEGNILFLQGINDKNIL